MAKNYKNAFNCKKCPGRNDEQGCPAWMEVPMQNTITGETRVEKDCQYILMPKILISNTQASDCVSANLSALPNKLEKAFDTISVKLIQGMKQIESKT